MRKDPSLLDFFFLVGRQLLGISLILSLIIGSLVAQDVLPAPDDNAQFLPQLPPEDRAAPASADANFASAIISEIVLRHEGTLKKKTIRSMLTFSEGDVYNRETIRESFRLLYESKEFNSINFYAEELPTSEAETARIRIIVDVKEHPIIVSVQYVGNQQYRRRVLQTEIGFSRKQKYRENEMQQAREDIFIKYLTNGFNSVRVDYRVDPHPEKDGVVVTFFIKEGSRVVVKNITFENNNIHKNRALRKVLETKTSGVGRSGAFDPEVFDMDKQKLIYAFQTKGYVEAEITATNYSYRWKNPAKKRTQFMDIVIAFEENELFYFGKTTLQGNQIFPSGSFERRFQREEGEIFDQSKHDADIAGIYERYQSQGYIFSRVTPVGTTNEDNSIDYVFDIYEGRKAHVENIFIDGLIKTKEYVVRREITLEEGETFNVSELRASLLRLNRLGYFSEITPDYTPGSAEGLMNVAINVREQPTGQVSGGISYSTIFGFGLTFNLEERNFLGRGQTLGLGLNYGPLVKQGRISFTEPWVGGRPVSLGGSFSYSKFYREYFVNGIITNADGTTRDTLIYPGGGGTDLVQNNDNSIRYTEDLISFTIFSRQNLRNWFSISEAISVNYSREYLQDFTVFPERYRQLDVYELNEGLFDPPPPLDEQNLFYIISTTLSRDRRNSLLNPTSGTLARFNPQLFVGDYKLTKWHFDAQAAIPLARIQRTSIGNQSWSLVLFYSGRFRTLGNSLEGNITYPERLYYQFFRTELRGWNYFQIFDFRTERFGRDILLNGLAHGRALIEHEFELRMGLPIDILQIMGFFELGSLSQDPLGAGNSAAFLYDFQNYMYGTGFGFRLNVPVLPIRFYWAWRFVAIDGELVPFQPSSRRFLGINGTSSPTFVLDFQITF